MDLRHGDQRVERTRTYAARFAKKIANDEKKLFVIVLEIKMQSCAPRILTGCSEPTLVKRHETETLRRWGDAGGNRWCEARVEGGGFKKKEGRCDAGVR